ncbi:MAG: hypothetical protein IKH98_04455 [Candidatus Methanomethylophilaceae archaeon]|nr:hypothetical protein [Candidatus Methanomethylophilaceae archaeon]
MDHGSDEDARDLPIGRDDFVPMHENCGRCDQGPPDPGDRRLTRTYLFTDPRRA